jgi:hypothetical protein
MIAISIVILLEVDHDHWASLRPVVQSICATKAARFFVSEFNYPLCADMPIAVFGLAHIRHPAPLQPGRPHAVHVEPGSDRVAR